jgi:hypothetical protein
MDITLHQRHIARNHSPFNRRRFDIVVSLSIFGVVWSDLFGAFGTPGIVEIAGRLTSRVSGLVFRDFVRTSALSGVDIVMSFGLFRGFTDSGGWTIGGIKQIRILDT